MMQIDWWTLALQAINFLVLVWLLQRFLYKPVQAVIARRREQTESVMAEARSLRSEAEKRAAELEEERKELASARDKALEDAHAQARKEHEAILQRARAEAERITDEARERIAIERRDAEHALRDKAAELGVEIARKLLAAAAEGQARDPMFVDGVLSALAEMTPEKRATLRDEVTADGPVRVVTAAPLSQEHADRLEKRLVEALGGKVALSFADDADLIAGVELHFPHTVLRHSWRDDLNRVMKELQSDGQTE